MIALFLVVALADPAAAVNTARADPVAGAAALLSAAEGAPRVAEPLRLLAAEALLATAPERAAALAGAARDPRWSPRADWIRARSAAVPCEERLRTLGGLKADPPWITEPARLALAAQLEARCGDPQRAAGARRRLLVDQPAAPEARGLDASALSPSDLLERAKGFEAARAYARAIAELEALIGGPLDARARFERARIRMERVRTDYDRAAAEFAALVSEGGPLAEEAAWSRARALARGDRDDEAQAAFRAYRERFPQGAHVEDARFFAAFLDYERGRFEPAARAFATLREGGWAAAARWYHAWCHWLSGSAEAAELMDAVAEASKPGSAEARRAAYWAARAWERRAPIRGAVRSALLLSERMDDWYGLLTLRRYPVVVPRGSPFPPAEAPPVPPQLRGVVAELDALAAAGLDDFARRAFVAARPQLEGHPAVERWLGERVGVTTPTLRAAVIPNAARLRALPRAEDPELLEIWRAGWPRPFRAEVTRAAAANGVEPALVYSFIRKESLFEADAISRAHAIGLMQILPRTAARVQADRGAPPPGDLFAPSVNIDIGTWYIGALQRSFGGQLPLVAAGYNAGPVAVRGWIARGGEVDTDVFVEQIPFKQAREYVKRLTTTLVDYRIVHFGHSPAAAVRALPIRLRLEAAAGALDY